MFFLSSTIKNVNKSIKTKLNILEPTEKIIQAQLVIKFFIFVHKNEEISFEFSFIKVSTCSMFRLFIKFSTKGGNQNHSIQDVL